MEYTEIRKKGVYLGRAGEDGMRTVWLDVTRWAETYAGGAGVLLYTSPKGQVWPMGYRTETDEDAGTVKLVAPVTAAETAVSGIGRIEARWMSGGAAVKSQTFNALVLESMYTGEQLPDAVPGWVADLITELNAAGTLLEELAEVASEVEGAAGSAEAAADSAAAAAGNAEAAEAWAVGKRGGEDVDDEDPAYGNNAKYYAESAADSAELAMAGTPEGYAALVNEVNNRMPAVMTAESTADLDVCDVNGKVLVRMEGGHIKTKNFSSDKVGDAGDLNTTAKSTLVAAINELDEGVEDLEEAVAGITGGNSNVVTAKNVSAAGVDAVMCDEGGYVILQCAGGNVQTKNFDSAQAQKMILATGDSTDRAAEINAALAARGECRLGPGDFYVSGIVMPGSTTLSGCGAKTRIILLSNVTSGAAVKMKSYCTVKDVLIGTDESYTPGASPANRYGILRENDGDSHYIFGKISNVSIVGISQALALKDTVTADRTGLLVENVSIWKCDVGISITKCEYSRFSNVIVASCYTGVKNNGGNNLFANCTFISCTECFVMDDTSVTNSGHGSVVGCQFNHAGSNSGIAVKANGMENGFVFSGCQFFASRIEITNSIGIVFNGCNFGGTSGQSGYQISVTNNDGTNRVLMIAGCVFATDLILSKTNSSGTTAVIVSSCYKQNGTQITAN